AGHSAGAHIAVMMAVNAEYLAKQSLKPTDFSGVVGLAGPYDFLPLKSERLKTIFGSAAELPKSQPINFVDGKSPPMLLAVGLKDGTVWPRNSYNLAEKIKKNSGLAQVVQFENYGHVDMAAKLAKPLRGNGELLKAVADFIQNTPEKGVKLSRP
ncbi:MAG: alpha/beta hydrolase, partial [Methylotenera sp.]